MAVSIMIIFIIHVLCGVTPWKMTVLPCPVACMAGEHSGCQLTWMCHGSHRKMDELERKISNYPMLPSLCLCRRAPAG